MSTLALKLRGPLIAVVVLLFSAGLALAGGGLAFPDAGTGGVDQTAEDSGSTAEDGDDAEDGDAAHGDLVSQAAQMETPDGFKNHGAFVSCVARKLYEDNAEADAEVVLAELTPEDCERNADEEEADADDPEEDAETDDPADAEEDDWANHGAMVSEAAQMETPDGFKNHGAFVSCVAKMSYGKKGSEAPADFVLADLTPEDCQAADEADSDEPDSDEAKADKGKDKADKAKNKHGKRHGRNR
jgi:hypothetical protein